MDLDLYDYERALGVKFISSKAERLQTGESAMTHATVITAVHLNADGRPVRYKVENSWSNGVLCYDRSVVSYYDRSIQDRVHTWVLIVYRQIRGHSEGT